MDSICSMDIIEFCTYLEDKNFDEDIVHRFSKNKICGSTFLNLTEDDLKDLLPVIGERVRVRKLLKEARQVCNYTRNSACWSDVELREPSAIWLAKARVPGCSTYNVCVRACACVRACVCVCVCTQSNACMYI